MARIRAQFQSSASAPAAESADTSADLVGLQLAGPEADLAGPHKDVGKRAAVAAVLREGALGPEVLFIRRAEQPRDPWSGHMAFPGGRESTADTNLLATAVRETREELGIDLVFAATLLGSLAPLPAVAGGRRVGLSITPFVFELTTPVHVTPNYEVAEWLWAPLSPLFLGKCATTIPYEFEGHELALPGFEVEGHIVWGLTYRMLEMLFAELR